MAERGTHTTRDSSLGYVPALDGLRAISLIVIIAYHNNFNWIHGGFLGVTMFFTLSGFLITTLLLEERSNTGRIALGEFWKRRARRLIPGSLAVLLGIAVLGFLQVWTADQLVMLRTDIPTAALNVANWNLAFSTRSYAALFANPSPTNHYWSLAIEEQFYLVLPVFIAITLRYRSLRTLHWLLGLITMASFAWSAWLSFHALNGDFDRIYLGTDTRLGELTIGAWFAVYRFRHVSTRTETSPHARLAGGIAAGLALAALPLASINASLTYRGVFLAFSVLCVVVLHAALTGGVLGRILSWPPLVSVGRVSYAAYLVHWPIHVVITPQVTNASLVVTAAIRLAVTLVAATVLTYLVERPARFSSGRLRAALPAAGFGAMVVLLAGMPTALAQVGRPRTSAIIFEGGVPQPPTERSPGIPRLLIVGDSVAHGFAVGLYRNSTQPGIELVDGSAPSCGTLRVGTYTIFTEWIAAREACNAWEQSLDRFAPDAVLILRSLPDLTDRRIDGQQISIQDQEYQRRWKEQMDADIERIASRGARPVIAIPPRLSPDYAEGAIDDRHDLLFVMLRAVAEAHDLPVIDLDTLARELGLNRRFDNVHLSERDEVTLAEAALPAIKEVLPST